MVRLRAKVTIDSLQEGVDLYLESIGTKMTDVDICIEVV